MEIKFGKLIFKIENEKITLNGCPFVEVQLSGRDKDSHLGAKLVKSSEGGTLKYVSHRLEGNILCITQANDAIKINTVFTAYEAASAISAYTEIENISGEEIAIEEASAFVFPGFAGSVRETYKTYLYRFTQSHHGECQPRKNSLFELGLTPVTFAGQYRIARANVGSWSTKEELPQGILEYEGRYIMFQLESNHSWYYELGDEEGFLYLYLGGANYSFGNWCKKLASGETYRTIGVAVAFSDSLNGVLGEMTKYRRHIAGRCEADNDLPVIFNEYMHLSWDCPSEEKTKIYALAAAKAGADYYVIDCGWHDEEPGKEIYPYVGKWKESKTRFPHGVRKTTDYIRSLGMKAGLWIEPEIVGCKCKEMLEYYDDDCFVQRNGKRICVMGRYFLDYRNPKVIGYMTETIRRMAEDYGADYIKLDYNQDMGAGTDFDADSAGEGLEQCAKAYLNWIDTLRGHFPGILFETCSSGGMRIDYETLKHFSVVSTSDQTDYKKYPYIAGNILSAVLPEQAAVWSYPVGSPVGPNGDFYPTVEWVEKNISEEQVIMNMINSFLGRIHLASHIGLLSEKKFALVKEAVDYIKDLSAIKRKAFPFFPFGFTEFGREEAVAGFIAEGKIYLAVWNLGEEKEVDVFVGKEYNQIKCVYPKKNKLKFFLRNGILKVVFTEKYQARFFEIEP